MTTIRRILNMKGRKVWTVGPNSPVQEALQVLADHNIGALPVTEGDRVVGIFSERDFARKVCLEDKTDMSTPVREYMTHPVYYIGPDQSIEDCMSLMTEKHIRHLPVLEDERLTGIISIGDVVKEIISDREYTIQHLENYITGRKY